MKKMTTDDLEELWIKTFGNEKNIPYFEIEEHGYSYGKTSWAQLAEGIHGLKTMEILSDDEGPMGVYYTQDTVEITLCMICDTLTSWSTEPHTLYRSRGLYGYVEREQQLTIKE